jgi:hypothetical protein
LYESGATTTFTRMSPSLSSGSESSTCGEDQGWPPDAQTRSRDARWRWPAFANCLPNAAVIAPVVEFGQRAHWHPELPYTWAAWGAIALGWALATPLVAGLSNVFRR